jgi:citrate lyase synthetase
MERFLTHLERSLRENPRQIYFVYVKPLYHDLVMNNGFLQLLSKDGSVAIYQHVPNERCSGREGAAMLLDKE